MLVDIEFLLKENLENALSFFAVPTKENHEHVLAPRDVERIFGHEVVSEGVYYVGSPNAANHLREVVPQDLRHAGDWCGHRSYGTASDVEEILAYARPDELGQACVVLIVPTNEIPPKSGPWVGPRDDLGHPIVGKVVLDWSLVPIDADKLEQAIATRASASPSP